MNGEELQDLARVRVQDLPGADLEHPFGLGWDVYKVRGKVFMLLTDVTDVTDVTGEPIVILKTAPRRQQSSAGATLKHHPGLPHEQKALDHVAPLRRAR